MKATLTVSQGRPELAFEDSGEPMPASVERILFHEPVADPAGEGLGIGLYQVGRLAEQSGYAIELTHNEPGRVAFRIRSA